MQIMRQTQVDNCEVIAPPEPRKVMESAAKAVRLAVRTDTRLKWRSTPHLFMCSEM